MRKEIPALFPQYKNKFTTMQKKFIVNLELMENGGDLLSHAKRWWQAVPAERLCINKKELRILIELRTLVKMAATYSPTPKGDDKQYQRRDWA